MTLVFPLAASHDHGTHQTLVDATLKRDAFPASEEPAPSRVLRLSGGPFARFGVDGSPERGIDVELFAEASNATVDLRGWPDVVVVRVRKANMEAPHWPSLTPAAETRLVVSVDWDRWEDEEADEDPGPEPGAWTSTMGGGDDDDEGDEEGSGSEDDDEDDGGEEYADCEGGDGHDEADDEAKDEEEDEEDDEADDDEDDDVKVHLIPGGESPCFGGLDEVAVA